MQSSHLIEIVAEFLYPRETFADTYLRQVEVTLGRSDGTRSKAESLHPSKAADQAEGQCDKESIPGSHLACTASLPEASSNLFSVGRGFLSQAQLEIVL